jgi:hypothetical protein
MLDMRGFRAVFNVSLDEFSTQFSTRLAVTERGSLPVRQARTEAIIKDRFFIYNSLGIKRIT